MNDELDLCSKIVEIDKLAVHVKRHLPNLLCGLS